MKERPLHVVFLARWLGFPDGMAESNRVRLLARALAEQGASVTVLSTGVSERPPVIQNIAARGVHQGIAFEYTTGRTVRPDTFLARRLVEFRGWLVAARRLRALKAGGRLDCVYLWWHGMRREPSRQVVLAALRLLRVPVVIELNERPRSLGSEPRCRLGRQSHLTGVSGVVAISRWLAAWAHWEARRLGRDVAVLEVPIVVDVFEHLVTHYRESPPALLLAAAPQYEGTIRFTLDAMTTVWRDYPAARLHLTGVHPDIPAAKWLRDMIARGELDERVVVAGYVSRQELLSMYSAAHALLIPLFDDDVSNARFPTKIGEYLASGRPVVTSAVGEVTRYLRDGETAYVAPPGDASRYGAKICEVLADRSRAEVVGATGHGLAERTFHYALYGPALYRFFQTVARAGSPTT